MAGNLLSIRVGEENVMLSSRRADRYWKSGRGGTAVEGARQGREGLMKIGSKRACVRQSDMVW